MCVLGVFFVLWFLAFLMQIKLPRFGNYVRKNATFNMNCLDIMQESGKLSPTKTKNHILIFTYGTHTVR